MRLSARTSFSILSLLVSACSLVVDFPAQREAGDDDDDTPPRDAAIDATRDADMPRPEAGRDAGDMENEGGAACDLDSHRRCADDELCCDRRDGKGASCVATSNMECAVCGEGCIDERAPNCGERACECRPGTGAGCPMNQICMGSGADARCVECATRASCAADEQCVDNECVECSRTNNAGCGGATPICNADNRCVACSASPNNCPSGQQCVGGVGCVGCSPTADLDENGCSGDTPVCRPIANNQFQCDGCDEDSECKGGYCRQSTGECINACDADLPNGTNGCRSGTPICKATASGYACVACGPGDCPMGRFCASTGPQAGNCVLCRSNMDCSPSAPMCNTTTGTCTGCAAGEVFDNATGECVECTTDMNCAGSAGGRYCHPTRKECVQCDDLPAPDMACMARNPMTPRCGTAGLCVGCTSDAQCAMSPTTPFCISGVCSACTAITNDNMANSRCAMRSAMTPACLASGACGRCDPTDNDGCMMGVCTMAMECVTCVPSQATATDRGCTMAAPDCIAGAGGAVSCVQCDPAATATPPRCMMGECAAPGMCMAPEAGVPPAGPPPAM
jgi:hypothetical protein